MTARTAITLTRPQPKNRCKRRVIRVLKLTCGFRAANRFVWPRLQKRNRDIQLRANTLADLAAPVRAKPIRYSQTELVPSRGWQATLPPLGG